MYKGQAFSAQSLQIPEQISPDKEQEQYSNNYKQRLYSPTLSNNFRLTKQRIYDSTFILGDNQTTLFLQVIVSSENDKETKLPIASKPILLYIMQQNTKDILKSYQVYHHRIVQVKLQDKRLYQILAKIQPQQDQNYRDKVVRIEVQLSSNAKKAEEINKKWLKDYWFKISKLYDQSSSIFLDSLQNWDIIRSSSVQYITHHAKWKLYSIGELILLIVIVFCELAYLRKLLHRDSIVLI